ncbi:VOC family protein [Chitinophaga sp. Hz27]|uniref:VOC family protein n=1 Tax=Chitinophaga sp. Hz27 TaxID=3347169 RepID=UPI0035DB2AD2
MASVNPYLNFNGNCEEAFNLYKSVFGGEFFMISRFSEMPPEFPCDPSEKDKIMHVSLPFSNGTILMGSDAPKAYQRPIEASNLNVAVNVDSEDEANKVFNGLSAGGTVTMPMAKTFWNAYFGMLTDKFGVNWMVSYDLNPKK